MSRFGAIGLSWWIVLATWASVAQAAADVWDANGAIPPNGIWATANNWADNTTPGNSDTATFSLADSYTVTFNANPLAIQALTVTSGTAATFASSGGARTLLVNSATGGQDITINGGSKLSLGTSGNPLNLTVGDDLTVNGVSDLNVNFGSDVNTLDLFLATVNGGGNGTVTVDGIGSQLNVTNGFNLAQNGNTGTLTYRSGAAGTLSGTVNLAPSSNPATLAILNVDTSANLNTASLAIGNGGGAGTGTLNVNGSSTLVQSGASTLSVGTAAACFGNINIGTSSGGAVLTTGTGAVTINATGTVAIGAPAISSSTFSVNGDITINGGVLTRSQNGIFALGTGRTLTVQNGGRVSISGSYTSADSAVYNITGTGSKLEVLNSFVGGALHVNGNALFQVSAGGLLTADSNLNIGAGSSLGNGSLTVDGVGSSVVCSALAAQIWGGGGHTATVTLSNNATGNFAGAVFLADSTIAGTSAVVNVLSGADLSTGNLSLAIDGGTSASLNVQGSGSTVTQGALNSLTIGHSATGTAVVNIGTTVSGATLTTGSSPLTINATGTVTIGGGANTGTLNANGNVTINGGVLRRQVTGSAFNLAAGRTMAIQNGGDAIFNGDYTTAANAIYNVSGAGSTLQTGNLLAIGNGAQVNVTSGGVINAVPLVGDGSVGTLLVDASTVSFGSGGLTNWGTNGGIATVTFSNGATGTLSGFGIFIGSGGTPGTTGLVNVQSGASLSVGGLFIGAVGGTTTSGTLNINGNGSVTQSGTNQLSVGSSAGTGVINIGTTTTGGTLNTGSGLFTISATGAVNVGAGANTGILNANGDILIDGGELTQSNGSIFTLDSGKTMTIGNGGTASFNNLRIDLDDHVNVISAGSVSSETVIEIAFASDGTLAVDGSGSSAMVTNSFATPSTWGLNGHTATVTFSSNSIGLFNSGINLVGNFDAGTTANVSVETGADLTAAGVMNVAAIGGGATAATLSVVGTGSTVTVSPGAFSPAALSIGHSSAGTGEVSVVDNAVLTVDTGGSTNLNATGTINIDGGTVDLKTLNDNGGTINFIAGSLSYIGNLTVGSGGLLGTNLTLASNHALTLSGTTTIDAGRTLTLDGGTLDTGSLVVNGAFHFDRGTLGINGGTISGLGNLTVGSNAELRARGVQTLAIVGVAGSTITATGSLTLGDATKVNGVYSNGTVQVGANTVTFADANDAVLDSAALVTLGVGGSPGTLSAANGLTLDFGGNATGFGTVNTPNSAAQPLTNNGHIAGNSGAQPITLTGYVKGVGTLDNVVITGTDAPGFSPATVVRGSVVYDGALEIEIGGTSSGSFDRIQHMLGAGLANLGGTLDVELINGFHPALDDAFEIITAAGGVSGMFETLAAQLPALTSGLEWTINYGANNVVLRVVAVGLLGDYNQNGFVDAADYTVWRNQLGSLASLPNDNTVGVGPDDYTRWKTHFGESSGLGSGAAATVAAPEPATLAMLLGGILGMCVRRRRLSQDGSFGRTIR